MTDVTLDSDDSSLANWEAQASIAGLSLPKRIGVCINFGHHIWYKVQAENEHSLAAQLGIELAVADAQSDAHRQARQIESFIEEGVDALILSAVDALQVPEVLQQAYAQGIPVVTESIWMESPAISTNAMINEYVAGLKVGWAAAEWLARRPDVARPIKVLDVTVLGLAEALQRSEGFLAGLRARFPEVVSTRVDGHADIETAAEVVTDLLQRDAAFDVIFGIDDESAIGGRLAFERLQLPLNEKLICSFGFSGLQAYDWLTKGVYQIVCAMFPEYQAHMLLHAAIYAYNKRSLPQHLVAPCVAITAETLPHYYTWTAAGLHLNVAAVKAISTLGEER